MKLILKKFVRHGRKVGAGEGRRDAIRIWIWTSAGCIQIDKRNVWCPELGIKRDFGLENGTGVWSPVRAARSGVSLSGQRTVVTGSAPAEIHLTGKRHRGQGRIVSSGVSSRTFKARVQ